MTTYYWVQYKDTDLYDRNGVMTSLKRATRYNTRETAKEAAKGLKLATTIISRQITVKQ